MQKQYKVNATSLHIRSTPVLDSSNKNVVGYLSNGAIVTITEIKDGWGRHSKGWSSMNYLTFVKDLDVKPVVVNNSKTVTEPAKTVSAPPVSINPVSLQNSTIDEQIYNICKLFGAPPQYTKQADPRHFDNFDLGRIYAETFLVNPTIVSMCPGGVKYLPQLNKKEQEKFFNYVKGISSGDPLLVNRLTEEFNKDKSGTFYTFTSKYNSYIRNVNMLNRIIAIQLGIGDRYFPGTTTKYKHFDWSLYREGGKSIFAAGQQVGVEVKNSQNLFQQSMTYAADKAHSFFRIAKKAIDELVDTVIDDEAFIHFYANGEGTASSENIDTTTRASAIENLFNESTMDDMAKDLNFLVGGVVSDQAKQDFDRIVDKAGSGFLANVLRSGKGYLEGARMIFPQMLDDVSYGRTMTVTCRFVSPSGDPESVYLRTLVPTSHILCFGLPTQYNTSNMYTYPYLVKLYCQGWFNCEMGVVSNVKIQRGGQDDRSWTIRNLTTEIEVSFDVTPLYSSLMLSSTSRPLATLSNTGLIEYLAALTGLQMKKDNIQMKTEMAMALIGNSVRDIPANVYRGLIDSKLLNTARGIFQFP